MALLQKGVALAARRMPKMISPRSHAVLDYAIAGSFLVMGALFWKRSRRAAVGALFCGGATTAVSLLTDYPGGVKKVIPYPLHGTIDGGLVAMTAAIPRLMNIEKEHEAKFFSRQALAKTAITAMTDFDNDGAGRSRQEQEEQQELGV